MQKGFTLIELSVIVLTAGILAAAAPLYGEDAEKSLAAEGMTIVSSLGKAGKTYVLKSGQNPQFAKWSELDINYDVQQPDKTTADAQIIGNGNWSCRFYDFSVGCFRRNGNISYSLDYAWGGSGLLSCMSGTDEGKRFCKSLGCKYAQRLIPTPTYVYHCNQQEPGQAEPPYNPPPPCVPQTVCVKKCPPAAPPPDCPVCPEGKVCGPCGNSPPLCVPICHRTSCPVY